LCVSGSASCTLLPGDPVGYTRGTCHGTLWSRATSLALRGVRHRSDKFSLLGHLYQAFMDFGKYRESLEFANRQLGISEELDSAPMRAEAYLNLARAHQTLGGLDRALSYARHALYNDCGGGSTAGWVHHTVASVSLELGAFSKAMDSFQKALAVAQAQNDNTLLLQEALRLSTVVGDQGSFARAVRIAGDVYRRKCDFNKALRTFRSRRHRCFVNQILILFDQIKAAKKRVCKDSKCNKMLKNPSNHY
ncbi:unnamed protein product, partial [Leptidea sinapis]